MHQLLNAWRTQKQGAIQFEKVLGLFRPERRRRRQMTGQEMFEIVQATWLTGPKKPGGEVVAKKVPRKE